MKVGMYSFDCRDAAGLAEFWARVLMRTVRWVVFNDPEGNTFRIFAPRP
ncbi:hypothetical protein [Nocardia terpenica]|uniref:Glyoxalase-like domain-containing protein n=1 Tax=Nocardia terpenica TaxID=455432 RepID=A0A6G9ZB22_9NOCA|nr:hypothetical protein [Nocardia terpenica]QIS22610.1 hypothetical protein F6W96_34010 [Nocardia terpenica]